MLLQKEGVKVKNDCFGFRQLFLSLIKTLIFTVEQ